MAQGGNGNGNSGNGRGNGGGRVSPLFSGNLRHLCPLDEGTGRATVRNWGQINRTGSYFNGTGSSWRTGVLRNGRSVRSYNFPGTVNVFVNLPNTGSESYGKNWTLGGWCRADTPPDQAGIISKGSWSNQTHFVGITATNLPMCYFRVGGVEKKAQGGTAISTTFPMSLVVGTYDGASIKLYVNERLVAETAETGTPDTNTEPIHIGTAVNSIYLFDGDIAYPFLISRAITAGEVFRISQEGPAVFGIPDVLLPPEFNGQDSAAPPSPGTGYLGSGSGSLLRGVSNIGSQYLAGVVIGGHTPQDGGYH